MDYGETLHVDSLQSKVCFCLNECMNEFSQKFHQTAQYVTRTKHRHCWKGSNSVILVFYVNSGLETGFRLKYCYSENT